MQEPQPQLRVGAIHVNVDNLLPFDQGQQLFQTYSLQASHFPSGIKMQLIPENLVYEHSGTSTQTVDMQA